jgi:hypothetical protein
MVPPIVGASAGASHRRTGLYPGRVAMSVEPTTVWMLHARTGMEGRKGRLSLEDGAVRFDPVKEGEPPTVVPFGDIRRARRVLASPVLELRLRTPNGHALEVIGFYFTRPPSLDPDPEARVLRKHRAKSRAVNDLRRANLDKKESIAEWVRQIRSARP